MNLDRIAVNPQIHFGKPCITNTRITVQSVLELINEGLSFGEIIQDYYPDLQVEDIYACRVCFKSEISCIKTHSYV
jgi:uncharacterized protein (DUF433 family)